MPLFQHTMLALYLMMCGCCMLFQSCFLKEPTLNRKYCIRFDPSCFYNPLPIHMYPSSVVLQCSERYQLCSGEQPHHQLHQLLNKHPRNCLKCVPIETQCSVNAKYSATVNYSTYQVIENVFQHAGLNIYQLQLIIIFLSFFIHNGNGLNSSHC